jgi:hypothetical protein
MRHLPGTPFSARAPRSSNSIPEPATRSFTVEVTSTSPDPASAAVRAPICTAIPRRRSSTSSTSPVCNPLRTSRARARTCSAMAHADRIARAGPSNVARKPCCRQPWSDSNAGRSVWNLE